MAKPKFEEHPDLLTRTRKTLRPPSMYRVLLHNDDYTTQEFVVWILKSVFFKPESEAIAIMLAVHQAGIGVAGVYPRDVAETKVSKVLGLAETQGFPLLCTLEAE